MSVTYKVVIILRERIVHMVDIKVGMVLSRDLMTEKGINILHKGTILSDAIIDKLTMHEIGRIFIEEEDEEEEYLEDAESMRILKKEYNKRIKSIKNIFTNISEGKSIEGAQDICLSLIENKKSEGEMIRCMTQIKSIDEFVYTHSLNVASICFLIGEWMGLDKKRLEDVTLAGLLSDIGKAKISKEILTKSDLTLEEKAEIEKHPMYGYQLIKENTSFSEEVCQGILMHHEKEDGSGYPKKLKSGEINLFAKIISVADIYSTITIDKVYKKVDNPFTVFQIFESPASQKFDPLISYILINNIAKYYIGDEVRLSNGKKATIVFIDNEFASRPLVKCEDNEIIDLKENRSIFIEKML